MHLFCFYKLRDQSKLLSVVIAMWHRELFISLSIAESVVLYQSAHLIALGQWLKNSIISTGVGLSGMVVWISGEK